MKWFRVAALCVLLCSACVGGFGRERGRSSLPGRSIAAERLPDTLHRFIVRHFIHIYSFTYRRDRNFYYVCDEAGGFYLFSGQGAILGFRLYLRQPSGQILDMLPLPIVSYVKEHYRGYYFDVLLPVNGGYRVEIFGTDRRRTLRFDGEGRFLREE